MRISDAVNQQPPTRQLSLALELRRRGRRLSVAFTVYSRLIQRLN